MCYSTPTMASYHTYIARCADGTLYTGSTNDLTSRVARHNAGQGAKYTRGRGPIEIVFHESFPTLKAAMQREREIKSWTRKQKEVLIRKHANTT